MKLAMRIKKRKNSELQLKLMLMLVSQKLMKFYLTSTTISHQILLEKALYNNPYYGNIKEIRPKRHKKIASVSDNSDSPNSTTGRGKNTNMEKRPIKRRKLRDNFFFRVSPPVVFSLYLSMTKTTFLAREARRRLDYLVVTLPREKKKKMLNFLFLKTKGFLFFQQLYQFRVKQKLLTEYISLTHKLPLTNFDGKNFIPSVSIYVERFLRYHNSQEEFSNFWANYWASQVKQIDSASTTFDYNLEQIYDKLGSLSIEEILLETDSLLSETSNKPEQLEDSFFWAPENNMSLADTCLINSNNVVVDVGNLVRPVFPKISLDNRKSFLPAFVFQAPTKKPVRVNPFYLMVKFRRSQASLSNFEHISDWTPSAKYQPRSIWSRFEPFFDFPNDPSALNMKRYLTSRDYLLPSSNFFLVWKWKEVLSLQQNASVNNPASLQLDWDLFFASTIDGNLFEQSKSLQLLPEITNTLYRKFTNWDNQVSKIFDPIPFSLFQFYKNDKYPQVLADMRSYLERLMNLIPFTEYAGQHIANESQLANFFIPTHFGLRQAGSSPIFPTKFGFFFQNTWLNWSISRKQMYKNALYCNHPFLNRFHLMLLKVYVKKLLYRFIAEKCDFASFWGSLMSEFQLEQQLKNDSLLELQLEKIDLSEDFLTDMFTRLNLADLHFLSIWYPRFSIRVRNIPQLGFRKFLQNSFFLFDWYYIHFYNARWYDFLPVTKQIFFDSSLNEMRQKLVVSLNEKTVYEHEKEKKLFEAYDEYEEKFQKWPRSPRFYQDVFDFPSIIYQNYPDRFVYYASSMKKRKGVNFYRGFLGAWLRPFDLSKILHKGGEASSVWLDRDQVKHKITWDYDPTVGKKNKIPYSSASRLFTQLPWTAADLTTMESSYLPYFTNEDCMFFSRPHRYTASPQLSLWTNAVYTQPEISESPDFSFFQKYKENRHLSRWLDQDAKYYFFSLATFFLQSKKFDYQKMSKLYFLMEHVNFDNDAIMQTYTPGFFDFHLKIVEFNFKSLTSLYYNDKLKLTDLLELLMLSLTTERGHSVYKQQQLVLFLNQLLFFRDLLYLCEEPLGEFWYSFFGGLETSESFLCQVQYGADQTPRNFAKYSSFNRFLQASFSPVDLEKLQPFTYQLSLQAVIRQLQINKLKIYHLNDKTLYFLELQQLNFFVDHHQFLKKKTQDYVRISRFLLQTNSIFLQQNKTYKNFLLTEFYYSLCCDNFIFTQSQYAVFCHQWTVFFRYYPLFVRAGNSVRNFFVFLVLVYSMKSLLLILCLLVVLGYFSLNALSAINIFVERLGQNEITQKHIMKAAKDKAQFESLKKYKKRARDIILTRQKYMKYENIVSAAKNIPTIGSEISSWIFLEQLPLFEVQVLRDMGFLFYKKSSNVLEISAFDKVHKLKNGTLYWGIRLRGDCANRNPLFYVRQLSSIFLFWVTLKTKWYIRQSFLRCPFFDP